MKSIKTSYGEELLIAHNNDIYLGKLIGFEPNKSSKEMYYEKKHKTLYLLYGKVNIYIDEEKNTMYPQDYVEIPPKVKHKIESLETSMIIEFSSDNEDNV